MTAIVGLINRETIAIAADSAITTVPSGKVVNGVNKIFCISNRPPVSLGFYHVSTFHGLSWEVLAKEYRDRTRGEFETIEQYENDFRAYLLELASNYQDSEIFSYWNLLFQAFCLEVVKAYETESQSAGKLLNHQEFLLQLKTNINEYPSITTNLPTLERFLEIFSTKNGLQTPHVAPIFEALVKDKNQLYELFHAYIDRFPSLGYFTGLFLAGFGSAQIFPQVRSFILIGYLDGALLTRPDGEKCFDSGPNAYGHVVTFAQDDVIKTVVSGAAPALETWLMAELPKIVQTVKNRITKRLSKLDLTEEMQSVIAKEIANDDTLQIAISFEKRLKNFLTTQFVSPTLQTLSHLPKQDLADLAESWLHLTVLNRRMTGQQESVGGEIDVLLITKGDGLIWVKRKHYFSAEQNYQFFVTKISELLKTT
jgi:hypothetical protein